MKNKMEETFEDEGERIALVRQYQDLLFYKIATGKIELYRDSLGSFPKVMIKGYIPLTKQKLFWLIEELKKE